jgi:long-chain acyl-CoA synthetase
MKTLLDLFAHATTQFASHPFTSMPLRWRTMSWSYEDFKIKAEAIARFLETQNIGHNDKVILISPNSPYWSAAFFGTLLRGATVVPLNPQSTPELVQKIIDQTQAKIILKSVFITCKVKSIPCIDMDTKKWEEFEGVKPSPITVDEHDLAEIVYTSGTTGDPKGVMLTHANIISNITILSDHLSIPNYTRMVSILPLFHMYEQVGGLFRPMVNGASIMYSPGVHSKAISTCLKRHKARVMLVVPEVLEALYRTIKSRLQQANKQTSFEHALKVANYLPMCMRRLLFWKIHKGLGGRLSMLVCGGAPLSAELENTWNLLGLKIYQGYGLTETSPLVSFNFPGSSKTGTVGRVVSPIQVKIASDGEILVKGPNVFQGYYSNKEKTAESFTEDGWYKTGDVGTLDGENFLTIGSRKKYLIIGPSGENVYPEDIEEKLKAQPEVKDAAVLGVQNGSNHEIVYAVLLGDIKDAESIIENTNKQLAPHQHIQDWAVWPHDDFPRSAIRKVKKNEVLEWVVAHESAQGKEAQATTQTHATSPLIKIIASIAGKDSTTLSPDTYLYRDLHFDSLKRIELVARLEDELDAQLDESGITQNTQIKDLEGLVKQGTKPTPEGTIKPFLFTTFARLIQTTFQNLIVFPLYALTFKIKIEGEENLENLKLPAVFMMNHISYVDVMIALRVLPGHIRKRIALGAAVDVFYQYRILAPLAEFLFNVFPLPRKEYENIKPGLERLGKILDKKYSVLIYPEGKISLDGKLQPLKQGAGLIASEMSAPVVPFVALGVPDLIEKYTLIPKKRGTITVRFGKPIEIALGTPYEEATKIIETAMSQLYK